MGSPAEIPIRSLIRINKESRVPVYKQIALGISTAIQRGVLINKTKLPGSRQLADMLTVHRKTVIAALEELAAQGWVKTVPNKGCFIVADQILLQTSVDWTEEERKPPLTTAFVVKENRNLEFDTICSPVALMCTDGLPDVRLAPAEKLARNFSSVLKRRSTLKVRSLTEIEGNPFYRQQLADYLTQTRGIRCTANSILTTRGQEMGLYLLTKVLIAPGDKVVVGRLGNSITHMIFQERGAKILTIPVDQEGYDVRAFRALCQREKIRMLYITPHHHYPTSVVLSATRRIALLQTAAEFGVAIVEDDLGYDFYFKATPNLPLASLDTQGVVVYLGSFATTLMPSLRQGYLVAPPNLIAECTKVRHIIDRQGDYAMEQVLGELIRDGELQRYLKKVNKVYKERYLLALEVIRKELDPFVEIGSSKGGLGLWLTFKQQLNLNKIARLCENRGVNIPRTQLYQSQHYRAIRLGFANFLPEEFEKVIKVLATVIQEEVIRVD